MLYFDTSFLVPLLVREPTSDWIVACLRTLPADSLTISHWTKVEFSSLLARSVRMRDLDAEVAEQVAARFEAMVETSFAVILPNAEDYTLAQSYLAHHETGLRAGDALHLAIAGNHRAQAIYSLDQTLLKAGRHLVLPVNGGTTAATQ
jgi:predicted nucleic acid-binding protein